ncbi:uncharacterized protein LOC105288071 [Ooceraea biroi]|uniref:Cysteine/serine-rich nuclear protein n=1 Tax=Ooceraea biroi TaxID=2015173 RepID=A0A026X3Q4_OOCBI|nr:uncharacterized protein LOC105288071 [Ooceraea biroi]XP_019890098.1 uncharacterized protein LOC105288071 [Ooceraea biroi]EZA62713.1 Cysteine/serine-rich nuclear protein [Ooceraea biroi]
MAETSEMELPSVHQDCLVEAQEDSTSVEAEPGSASSSAMATTTDVNDDAERQSVEPRKEDLVMVVCERLDEGLEGEEGPEEKQSSDLSRKPEEEEEEEREEEVDLQLKMPEEIAENDSMDLDGSPVDPLRSNGLSRMDDTEDTTHDQLLEDQQARYEESASLNRKRPAGNDFLPIGAEIKRIGVEISEEEATQLRSDVRRLSPVLVSLRERTLGEVSLTSKSCLLGDESEDKTMAKDNGIPEKLSAGVDIELQEADQGCRNLNLEEEKEEKKENEEEKEEIRIGATTKECEDNNSIIAEDRTDCASSKVDYDSEKSPNLEVVPPVTSESDRITELNPDDYENTNAFCTQTKMIAIDAASPSSSPVCRRLTVVLNRIKETEVKKDLANENSDENEWNVDIDTEDSPRSSRRRNLVEEEQNSSADTAEAKENLKKPRWQNDSSPMTRSKSKPTQEIRSPSLKECKVMLQRMGDIQQGQPEIITATESSRRGEREESAPVAVIGKLDVNEEVVLASSSPAGDNGQVSHELDSSETVPSSPEVTPDASVDVAEGADTETETETGSDSSEVSPIASIRDLRDVDMAAEHQLPCTEGEPLCCVEAMAPIMTRLETERPEAYTEDSAESLALATGTRDEVRSDGSDSGLGNEIPGDPGPAPAPESDSETSFLDRLPDDILSDKEKSVNQLDGFASSSGAPGTSGQPPLSSFRTLPAKSNLKRRLTDCMEGDESRSTVDEPVKKKRNIQFDAVTVYYFPRAQGFTCVPSQGGSTLGMSATHTHAERFSLSEHATEQRRIHRARLAQLRSERSCATNCVTETASSSEDPSDDTDEEPSDNEELDIDSYYFLQPVPTWQRRALLRAAGVRRIDAVEKDECRDIRASREHCGCGCKGYCDPESCPCSRANVKCQVDRPGFPCGCTRDGCANSSGRIEFNPVRVRTHFIHTLMRLELEKKQQEEESVGEHDQMADNHQAHSRGGPLRDIGGLAGVMNTVGSDACVIPGVGPGGGGGGFTTLHYETNHDVVGPSVVTAGCQQEVPGTREDSLDLYAIRDDCYASEDAVDGQSGVVQRKLHPEFSQAFQSFSAGAQPAPAGSGGGPGGGGGGGGGMSFQQSYQDYGSPYVTGLQSASRIPQFQPAPQFQSPPNPAAFTHYGPYGTAGQDVRAVGLPASCAQVHQVSAQQQQQQPPPPPPPQQQQHQQHSYDAAVFAQEEAASNAQYTNLTSSVQPMNVVQQMQQGKLEPFSELLSGRYSYYGEMHEPQQHHGTYGGHTGHGSAGKVAEMVEPGQVAVEQQLPPEGTTDDCDENFGEIIKKSMVETVSA